MPPKKLTLGFIGAGRAGSGLASSFARAGVNVVAIASRKIASAQRLAGCAIALAGPDALVEKLERLARALDAKPLRLPEGGRALYHAAANFSGAFVIALIQETIALWGKLGVAEAAALAALLPLLRGTADNVERLGAAGGLGSAVARGDVGTIRRHLDALAREAPESLELYRILSLRTIPLALAKGTLEPQTAEEITALLQSRGISPHEKSDT